MEKDTLRNILIVIGDYIDENDLENTLRKINRRSALIDCVRKTLKDAKLGGVQVLIRQYGDQLCIKFTDWNTEARKTRLCNILDNDFCDSMRFVKETKTTRVYSI